MHVQNYFLKTIPTYSAFLHLLSMSLTPAPQVREQAVTSFHTPHSSAVLPLIGTSVSSRFPATPRIPN